MTLKEAMNKYEEKFDDLYPLYCCMGKDEKDIIEDIKKCLETGKKFEYIPNVLY